MTDRRSFLKTSSILTAGVGAATLVPFNLLATRMKNVAPLERIRVGAIGINGMGFSDLSSMMKCPEVELVSICDVDKNVIAKRLGDLQKKAPALKPKVYSDYRKLLDDKDLDAVIIGTPDHWHCKMMVDASEAGKHIYCEKPVGHSIAECNVMTAAQKKYGNVVQVGQWQRSQKHFKDAIAYVHSGKLGQIRVVKTWAYMGWMKSIPVKPDSSVPAGVDYDSWLGMAQKRPFNPNRFHFEFRWFFDYAGGLMTDWGVHLIDYAMLGMKASHRYPKAVSALGGKVGYPEDAEQWPDTMSTIYDFGDFNLVWEQAIGINGGPYNRDHGIAFIGNNGTLIVDRGGWEVIPEKDKGGERLEAVPRQKSVDNGLDLHTRNFIDVIKTGKQADLKCPMDQAAMVAINCCMGNIAWQCDQKLHWDSAKGEFKQQDANAYLQAPYHNGIAFPKV